MTMPDADVPPPLGTAVHYAYMFDQDKRPTKQLDALLRAIARHVIFELGDRSDTHLTPAKLAAFYKVVGGNYDSLFIDMPHTSISLVWQTIGCPHSLQTTDDDFAPPSVPALIYRGFSRWESLEILLGPEEHVPFMQYAVRNWALKHPETGQDLPPDLPACVFPAVPDVDVDRWHKSCGDKFKNDAASSTAHTAPPPRPFGEPKFSYVRVNPFQSASPRTDHFGRPMSYFHVPGRPAGARRPDPSPRRDQGADQGTRRKSFSDYASGPSPETEPPYHGYSSSYLDPNMARPGQPRQRSHPKSPSSLSSTSDSLDDFSHPGAKPRRHPGSPPPPSMRRAVPPTVPVPPSAAQSIPISSLRPHRSDMRSDEPKRRSVPSPLGSLRTKLSETVSSMLPGGLTSDHHRPRTGSRQNSVSDMTHVRTARERESFQPSRLSHSYSDPDSDDSSDSLPSEELCRRHRTRDERERERERHTPRGREHDADRQRDWEEERESGLRHQRRHPRRMETPRRTSSHADIDRQRDRPRWEPQQLGSRDRAREERWNRERRRSPGDDLPAASGVTGRRYSEPAAYIS